MREISLRSHRYIFDLQACQTAGSVGRGVGRYSWSLFSEVNRIASPREVFALINSQLPHPPALRASVGDRTISFGPLPELPTGRSYLGGEQDVIDSHLISSALGTVSADIVHISHVFEGFSDRIAIPDALHHPRGQVVSATLYDLIPLIFKNHYFQSPEFERWYYDRLKTIRNCDLLLAISESSRRDAINLLGIEPDKIVTIHGGISDHFKPVADPAGWRAHLQRKYNLGHRSIVLYTGGDDYRKNLEGALGAYATLAAELRSSSQLVVICAMEAHRREHFRALAKRLGLSPNEVHFLGFVPEDDLVAFYSICDVFFFPSLYEGLGLPVLEAMACGAPVIGGNNSSIVELIDYKDAVFDARSISSTAERLMQILTEPKLAEQLRAHGLKRAKEFTWHRTARLTIDAFDEALARKRRAGTQAALSGWLPRRRLAVLTPLPPCKSGIADYNAKFLPYLGKHFEIDLYIDGYTVSSPAINAAFRVFDARDFRHSAKLYDAILYEVGNSEFHAYMLPLLEEFPGVVGLHDAFLSGLIGYLQFNLGEADRFVADMIYSHAGAARKFFAPAMNDPNAIGHAMVGLPCSKRVIDSAIGLISHSPFNLDIARTHYPQGFLAPYRIIPQMIEVPVVNKQASRQRARAKLGIHAEDFVISSFGHVAWTKSGDKLLEAFSTSPLANDPRCRLIFGGELARDDFGSRLSDKIQKSGLGNRVTVTGFLSNEDYEAHLYAADLAVQLRVFSRGGTPKGVLDCLSHGLPVIVNDDASYRDYPSSVVIKLRADPSRDEIAAKLAEMRGRPNELKGFSERGLDYVRTKHNPTDCAAQYASAIDEFIERNSARQAGRAVEKIAPHLAAVPDRRQVAVSIARTLDQRELPRFDRRKIFIDVSHIAETDHKTGIQRVVREVVRSSYCNSMGAFEAIAVQRQGSELIAATNWLSNQGLLTQYESAQRNNEPISLRQGDHLLMLDSSWAEFDDFRPIFDAVRKKHVDISTAIYDLLPLRLPLGNFVDGGREWFEGWLRKAIANSDNLICISRSTADDLIDFIEENALARPGLKVGWWHLGSKPLIAGEPDPSSPVVPAASSSFLLMVGTIEPRKNHALALRGFERLWAAGSNLRLVIAGKPGWMVDELLEKLRTHPELGRRLFVFENASDNEIGHLYRYAAALLFLSKGEGFGLPIVEAAHHGVPLVCSDIPSTREIAGDMATYIRTTNDEEFAADLSVIATRVASGVLPGSHQIKRLTWDESTLMLMNTLINRLWYKEF